MSDGEIGDSSDRAQLERLTFFSDAVFAIAMTLLVIEVRLPHMEEATDAAMARALASLVPNYVGFVVSFLVLGRFWVGHHMVMGELRAASPRLVWTNLFLLLAVAFMPFPTAVFSEHAGLRVAIGFYTGWLVVLGIINHLLMRTAGTPALLASDGDPALLARLRRNSAIPILIGVTAFAVGLIQPILATVALIAGAPLFSWLIRRKG